MSAVCIAILALQLCYKKISSEPVWWLQACAVVAGIYAMSVVIFVKHLQSLQVSLHGCGLRCYSERIRNYLHHLLP